MKDCNLTDRPNIPPLAAQKNYPIIAQMGPILFVLTEDLANAIIDMDNHGSSEGLGPITDASYDAWKIIVKSAEEKTGRKADWQESQAGRQTIREK